MVRQVSRSYAQRLTTGSKLCSQAVAVSEYGRGPSVSPAEATGSDAAAVILSGQRVSHKSFETDSSIRASCGLYRELALYRRGRCLSVPTERFTLIRRRVGGNTRFGRGRNATVAAAFASGARRRSVIGAAGLPDLSSKRRQHRAKGRSPNTWWRPTRSSSVPLLCVPFRRTSFARRSFIAAAPLTWNSLLSALSNCSFSLLSNPDFMFSTAFCLILDPLRQRLRSRLTVLRRLINFVLSLLLLFYPR